MSRNRGNTSLKRKRRRENAMRDYDRIGKAYWREFFQQHERKGKAQNPAA